MSWNAQRINDVANKSASVDYGAFEAIGLSQIAHACVLDVGCFDGYNTVLKFAPYDNIDRVVGIDPCEDKIAEARERTDDERFQWAVADGENFDARDESFDVLYFSHSFQHVRDKEQTLQNAFRMLKPGGFIVIKTIDDSLMISSPDPDNIVSQVTEYYAEHVRPFTVHTANTDRFNGEKCPALLLSAGFCAVRLKVFYTDTMGMSKQQRADLFERLTYFRRKVSPEAGGEVEAHMHGLLDAWEALFENDVYYFATPSVVAFARKPFSSGEEAPADYAGPWFEARSGGGDGADSLTIDCWRLAPMGEACLGDVMAIENAVFPTPWTPLAFVLELRYNRDAVYMIACDGDGVLCGYVGAWMIADVACITRIAVDPAHKREGLGATLIGYICKIAEDRGCKSMRLTVREGNAEARAFYQNLGFSERASNERYYSDPDEDGIVMSLTLGDEGSK